MKGQSSIAIIVILIITSIMVGGTYYVTQMKTSTTTTTITTTIISTISTTSSSTTTSTISTSTTLPQTTTTIEITSVCSDGFCEIGEDQINCCRDCVCSYGSLCEYNIKCSSSLVRTLASLDNLSLEERFKLLNDMHGLQKMTLNDFYSFLESKLEDNNYVSVEFGESHSSEKEQEIATNLIDFIASKRSIYEFAIESHIAVRETGAKETVYTYNISNFQSTLNKYNIKISNLGNSISNDLFCSEIKGKIQSMRNNLNDVLLTYTGHGHISKETCYYPDIWDTCLPPHIKECVSQLNKKSIAIILVDTERISPTIDHNFVFKMVKSSSSSIDNLISDFINKWNSIMSNEPDETYVVKSKYDEDVYFVLIPNKETKAKFTTAFNIVWNNQTLKDYMINNDILKFCCSFGTNWQIYGFDPSIVVVRIHDPNNSGETVLSVAVNIDLGTIKEILVPKL